MRKGCIHSAKGIGAFFFMSILFCVVVSQRSIFEWRRGWVKSAMGICCGFVEIYAHLEERV